MNYADFILLRLATPATRGTVFDALGLEAILKASYGAEVSTLSGPFQPIFDELAFGISVVPRATVDGWWNMAGVRSEGHFAIAGIGRQPAIRVDGLWRGAIVARATPAAGTIVDVDSAWPDPAGIDDEIIAALGSLPSDPIALENQRRTRYLARIRATMKQPTALTDGQFDAWLQRVGVTSMAELMAARGVIAAGTLKVTYSAPSNDVPVSPRPLPVSAALLVRDAPISLVDIVSDSRTVIEHLREAGLARAPDPDLGEQTRFVAAWIVPETVFDDADWPGGTSGTPPQRREDRRRNAAEWLGPEGIAIVTTAAHH